MHKCKRCEANCDPEKLIGGICLDCAEDERLRQVRAARFARIKDGVAVQMRLEDLYGKHNYNTNGRI